MEEKTYAEKLKDPRWQKLRLEIMQRDNFKCRCCNDSENTLHIHHKSYSKGNPWDAPEDNLITVCEICHSDIEVWKKSRNLKDVDLIKDVWVGPDKISRFEILKFSDYNSFLFVFRDKDAIAKFVPIKSESIYKIIDFLKKHS